MHIFFFAVNSELKYYHAVFGFVCTNKIANLAKKKFISCSSSSKIYEIYVFI